MNRLIALTGPAGGGKSTVARALLAHGYARRPFAGPLKAMLRAFYEAQGLTPDEVAERLDGARKERPDVLLGGCTPRWAMQTLGTDAWRRGVVDLLEDWGVVADDCRFPNEASLVRSLGGRVIELRRPGVERVNGHVSEAGVQPDAVVENDADPATVARRVLTA